MKSPKLITEYDQWLEKICNWLFLIVGIRQNSCPHVKPISESIREQRYSWVPNPTEFFCRFN